jgi:methionyl-tRNA formyltransferase
LKNNKLNVIVIGSVSSTLRTIEGLLRNRIKISGILGYEPTAFNNVSGFVDLKNIASKNDIDYLGFDKINDKENLIWAKEKNPDVIFAVGFSQLISDEWLSLPLLGCIGFHPTCLPKGRGRAPLAWIVLDKGCGSATYFLMDSGADSGPIFTQEKFIVSDIDDALSVSKKIEKSIDVALDKWLPMLASGVWNPKPQTELKSSEYGRRMPEDGVIIWNEPAVAIDRLVKASTTPHPRAFTFLGNEKVFITSSLVESKISIKGVVGRVLKNDNIKGSLIQCGNGLLWINGIFDSSDASISPRVGERFGFYCELEIYRLWKKIKELEDGK